MVQTVQRNPEGGRSTVNARPRVGNAAHVIEQTSHFCKRQGLVGFHRTAASVHECHVVLAGLDCFQRSTVLRYILEKVKEEGANFLALQQSRRSGEKPVFLLTDEVKAKGVKPLTLSIHDGGLSRVQAKVEGVKALLGLPRLPAVA